MQCTIDNMAVATVETGKPSPVLTGVGVGNATLTASLQVTDSGSVVTATAPLVVNQNTPITVNPQASGNVLTSTTYRNGVPTGSNTSAGSGVKDGAASSGSGGIGGPGGGSGFTGTRWSTVGLAEFDIPATPPGMTLSKVILTINLDSIASTASHTVVAYTGNGAITTADRSATGVSAGSLTGTPVGAKSLNVTTAVLNRITAGATDIGIRISSVGSVTSPFNRTNTWSAPKLEFTYTAN